MSHPLQSAEERAWWSEQRRAERGRHPGPRVAALARYVEAACHEAGNLSLLRQLRGEAISVAQSALRTAHGALLLARKEPS